MVKINSETIRQGERNVKSLSSQKAGRKYVKRAIGYDIEKNEIEKKLQAKSFPKEKLKKR